MAKAKNIVEFRKSEAQRRIEEKINLLERHSTSESLFDALITEIETLRSDESSDDLSVRDDYNYGVDYDIDLILELIRDLRWFTRYDKDEDDESITSYNLDYLRSYF